MSVMSHLTNTISLFCSNMATALTHFVLIVLIGRILGAEMFGVYTFALAYGSIFATIPNGGFDRILVREIARHPDSMGEWVASATAIRWLLSMVTAVGMTALAWGIGYRDQLGVIVVLYGMLVFNLSSELIRSVLYARGAMKGEAVLRIAGRALTLVGALAALAWDRRLLPLSGVLALTAALELALYGGYLWKRYRPLQLRVQGQTVRALVIESLPLAINTLLVVVYLKINVVLLTKIKGAEAAGWFSAAFTFVQLLQLFSASVTGAVLPVLARERTRDPESMRHHFHKAIRYLLLMALPCAVGITFLAPDVIGLIYGLGQYRAAVLPLRVVVWACVAMFLGSIFNAALVASDRQGIMIHLAVVAVIVCISLNLLLIPRWGCLGAALATVGTEAAVALGAGWAVRRITGPLRLGSYLLKPCIASAAMAGVLALTPEWFFVGRAALAGVVYAGLILGLKGLDEEDWTRVCQRVRQWRR